MAVVMRVTILGSGTSTGVPVVTCECEVCRSPDPRDRRLRPSILMEWDGTKVLVDTSTDLRQQALRHHIARIDAVLYTHHHADHVLGLDELRLYNWRQGGPVPVYGSRATLDALTRTFPFELHGARVVPIPVLHGRMRILGYRVGEFAYLTDVSAIPSPSYELLAGLEVLVLSALRPRPHPTHLSLEQALEEAARVRAVRTFLTHLGHEMPHGGISATLPEGVELAYDGMTVEVTGP
jgi:phosphoribosyl 1,2-cyclic phosphate phosphodiesterase